jgi:hypothetical protein
MSDKEFLARWSRRKREAKAVIDTPASVEPAPGLAPPGSAENPGDPAVDISSLPPIVRLMLPPTLRPSAKGIP